MSQDASRKLTPLQQAFAFVGRILSPHEAYAADVSVPLWPGVNLYSHPVEVPAGLSCVDLQTLLGADALMRMNAATGRFEACTAGPANFAIRSGEGYVVQSPSTRTVTVTGSPDCPVLNLPAGLNLIGVPTPPADFSCYDLLRALGDRDTVATIQRLNTSTGAFEPCGFLDSTGEPVGADFPITPGEAYLVHLRQAVTAFNPNDQAQCLPPCAAPTITAVTPPTGPVGTTVTIAGTNLDCGPVTLRLNGVSTVITSRTPTAITTVIPPGGQDGRFTLTTGGGTITVPDSLAFDVVLSKDFSLALVPAEATVLQNGSTMYRVTASGTQGFSHLVNLSVTGLPAGVTANIMPPMITAGQSALVTVEASNTAAITTATLAITGSTQIDGTSVARAVPATLTVQPGGQTALIGQFTLINGTPLAGIKLVLADKMTTTDAAGNFQLIDLPAGKQTLSVDATPADPQLPIYSIDVTLVAGQILRVAPFRICPPLPPERYSPINNATQDQVITDVSAPGASFTLPAGVTIMGWDGTPKTQMTIQKLSPDELPVPPPPGPTRSFYQPFFGTPAGGLPSAPIPVTLPNDLDLKPGDKAELWHYDAAPFLGVPGEWRMAGMGTVSQDGATIVADPGVGITRFCGVCGLSCFIPRQQGQPNPGEGEDGDPVNLFIGQMIVRKTDLTLPGRIPAVVHRTYNPFDPFGAIAGFQLALGPGWSLSVEMVLQAETATLRRLIMPGNARFAFVQKPNGTFVNTTHPRFVGAVLTADINGAHTLHLKDGTIWQFTPSTRIPGFSLLSEQIDRNGNSLTVKYDTNNRISRIIEPAGRELVFAYTAGRLTEISDPIGRTVRYSYNSAQRLETVIDPVGGTTRYTYDAAGRILTITDPRNITYLTNEYDVQGRVVRQTQADGGVWTFVYLRACKLGETGSGPLGLCALAQTESGSPTGVAVTNPRDYTTTQKLSATGLVIEIVDPLGQHTHFERDARGQITSITDSLGRVTHFQYDEVGNVTHVTDPAGNVYNFMYEPISHRLVKLIDPLEQITAFAYDQRGNITTISDPLGHTMRIAYNTFGQVVSVTDPLGHTMTLTYDTQGNLVGIMDPLGNTNGRTYDLGSRLIEHTDPHGRTVHFTYNELNQITRIVDTLGGMTTFTYDMNGNLLTITDALNRTTTYVYNNMDRLSRRVDAVGMSEVFAYDQVGNLTRHTDRKGQLSTFSYDALDNRTSSRYSDSMTHYSYDAAGRLVRATDTLGSNILLSYDVLDRLSEETTELGTSRYMYDTLGRRTTLTVAGQEPIHYSYDANSRLTQIMQGGQIVALTYDALGRRSRLIQPNGVITEYHYDAASRVVELSYLNSTGVLGNLTYAYDAAGNRVHVGGTFARGLLPAPVGAASYDAANRQVRFGDKTMTYDENGNLVSLNDNFGTTILTWDSRNRLAAYTSPETTAAFTYDAFGNRSSKFVNGTIVHYLYDELDIVHAIRDGITINYLRGLNTDEPFVHNGNEYYLSDALGSILGLTDPTGALSTRYLYAPFGLTAVEGKRSSNPFKYNAREDEMTGLYYYRSRYYSTVLKRFISEDPLDFAAGDTNLYAYVSNDPISYIDPTGLGKVGTVIKIVKRVGNWLRESRKVSTKEAINARRRGADVLAPNEKIAKQIEKNAFKNDPTAGDLLKHEPHKKGYRPHYQTDKKSGHTFYSVSIPGAGIGTFIGRKTGIPLLGDIIDFFNPLSDIQDVLNLLDDITGGADEGPSN
ncbi:MAG: RHS repeat-associated core domain-containing protein [Candidatus Tectimicrobiota bacterium]